MNHNKQSGKTESAIKTLAPAILSAFLLTACDNSFTDEVRALEKDAGKLEESRKELKESTKELRESVEKLDKSLIELGKIVYDASCKKEFELAIKEGKIPQPITKQSLLAANITTDLTYNDEMPLSEVTKWVESFGPEYKITNGKLDCSYLVLRTNAPAP